MTEISVEIQKKNPILPYKWLFWWVFNFRFLCEDVKCAKKVHELLFHVQIVKQVIYFFTPEKEIAPLVKWSLRLPYTFLSVGSPFIEEEGKMT